MDLQLRDRVALVSGGASGIGRACVHALADEGAVVVIVDRDPNGRDVAGSMQQSGLRVSFVETDVTDESSVEQVVRGVVAEHGALDTVVGCAGISGPVGTPIIETTVADWDRVQAVNVRGNFLLAKHAVPHLLRSAVGTIMFLASDSAVVAFEGMAPYSSSKASLVMLAKSLSAEHPTVRVNALCPGIVDTPMSRHDLGFLNGFDDTNLPVASARQIANHAVFLASPASAPMSGATVVVDFGYHVRPAVGALNFTPPE